MEKIIVVDALTSSMLTVSGSLITVLDIGG